MYCSYEQPSLRGAVPLTLELLGTDNYTGLHRAL